jgi:AP2-like factor, ANT lineage
VQPSVVDAGTQEEAAEAYDIAAIKFRGLNAVTNFDMSRYDVKSILDSSALPIGSAAKRLKEAEAAASAQHHHAGVVSYDVGRIASQLGDGGALAAAYGAHYHGAAWPTIAFQPGAATTGLYHPYAQQPMRGGGWCKQEQDHAVIAAAHSLQDLHHLNLGAAGAHDFFSAGQQAAAAAAMHGLASIDSASLEHSTGSNSVVYNGGVGDSNGASAVGSGGGYMMPMSAAGATTTSAMVSHEQMHARAYDEAKQAAQMGYESYLVNAENNGGGRMSAWGTVVSAAAAAAASSNDNIAADVGHGGAQLFSVWNDT